jgi:hypothetical protein
MGVTKLVRREATTDARLNRGASQRDPDLRA